MELNNLSLPLVKRGGVRYFSLVMCVENHKLCQVNDFPHTSQSGKMTREEQCQECGLKCEKDIFQHLHSALYQLMEGI